MALGDAEDFRIRLRKLIPFSWFPRPAQILWGLLTGAANVFSAAYAQVKYAKTQTRLATMSDAFLDIAAMDYCGARLPRNPGESDNYYRQRIGMEVLRLRNTRQSVLVAIIELTGRVPQIFEPWNTNDTAAWDVSPWGGDPFTAKAYWGDTSLPYQFFVNAFRPLPASGFVASDAQIYAAIAAVTMGGVTAWTSIQN
jgi:hypothetical protein